MAAATPTFVGDLDRYLRVEIAQRGAKEAGFQDLHKEFLEMLSAIQSLPTGKTFFQVLREVGHPSFWSRLINHIDKETAGTSTATTETSKTRLQAMAGGHLHAALEQLRAGSIAVDTETHYQYPNDELAAIQRIFPTPARMAVASAETPLVFKSYPEIRRFVAAATDFSEEDLKRRVLFLTEGEGDEVKVVGSSKKLEVVKETYSEELPLIELIWLAAKPTKEIPTDVEFLQRFYTKCPKVFSEAFLALNVFENRRLISILLFDTVRHPELFPTLMRHLPVCSEDLLVTTYQRGRTPAVCAVAQMSPENAIQFLQEKCPPAFTARVLSCYTSDESLFPVEILAMISSGSQSAPGAGAGAGSPAGAALSINVDLFKAFFSKFKHQDIRSCYDKLALAVLGEDSMLLLASMWRYLEEKKASGDKDAAARINDFNTLVQSILEMGAISLPLPASTIPSGMITDRYNELRKLIVENFEDMPEVLQAISRALQPLFSGLVPASSAGTAVAAAGGAGASAASAGAGAPLSSAAPSTATDSTGLVPASSATTASSAGTAVAAAGGAGASASPASAPLESGTEGRVQGIFYVPSKGKGIPWTTSEASAPSGPAS